MRLGDAAVCGDASATGRLPVKAAAARRLATIGLLNEAHLAELSKGLSFIGSRIIQLAWEDLTQTRPRTRRQEEKDAYELCPQQARKQDLRAKVFTLLQEAPWVLAVTTSLKGRVDFGILKLPSMRESAREVDSLSRNLASRFTAHLTAHGFIEKRSHWSMKWFQFIRFFGIGLSRNESASRKDLMISQTEKVSRNPGFEFRLGVF